jgi:hypothetical protein
MRFRSALLFALLPALVSGSALASTVKAKAGTVKGKSSTVKASTVKVKAGEKRSEGEKLTGGDLKRAQAIEAVTKEVGPWVPHNQDLIVRTALNSFPTNPHAKVTNGLLTVYVKQKFKEGVKGSAFHSFNRYANRAFLVDVSDNGEVSIVDQWSLAPQARIARWLGKNIPLKKIVSDVMASKKGEEVLGWLTASAAAAKTGGSTGLMAAGGLLIKAGHSVAMGSRKQSQLRRNALRATTAWIDKQGKSGSWPSVGQSFQHYKEVLAAPDAGATAGSEYDFAVALAAAGY